MGRGPAHGSDKPVLKKVAGRVGPDPEMFEISPVGLTGSGRVGSG